MFSDALAFLCLFVCWNKTRKKILRLLCLEGSSPPGNDHTGAEARTVSRNIIPAGNVPSIDFFFVGWFWIHTDSTPITAGFLFCFFAATHLTRPVHQERPQVVCSNKVARKRLGTPAIHVTCLYVSWYVRVVDTHSIFRCQPSIRSNTWGSSTQVKRPIPMNHNDIITKLMMELWSDTSTYVLFWCNGSSSRRATLSSRLVLKWKWGF